MAHEYAASAADLAKVERANASGKQPVVFVHGLWLLDSSWDHWTQFFEDAGYVAVAPTWPDDPPTVEEARENPSVFAGKSVGDVAAYQQTIIEKLTAKPALIGHSFGGLLVQILAGRGLSAATVAVDPAPSRGVLPLPPSAIKSSAAVLTNPANRHRAVALSFEQFRYGFANAVSEEEARKLYEQYSVAGSGIPIFQAGLRQLQPPDRGQGRQEEPGTRAHAGHRRREGPSGPLGHRQRHLQGAERQPGRHRDRRDPDRGHSLTIDSGWQEVAQVCLDFVRRFV